VAAGGGTGDVLVINNGVVQSAFPTSFDGQAITCDGAASCLMVGEVGETIYSAVVNPTTGKPQARSLIKAMSSVTGATCATATTCFAVGYGIFDSKLFARVSDIENGVPAAATTLAGQSLAAIACPTATTCWATGENPKGTGIVDSVPVPSVPTVTKVTPSTGPTTGGTPITITGTDFVTGATVVVGQGSGTVTGVIPATSVVVMSPTEITAVTGGGAKAGTWSLFVHTTGGTSAGSAGSDFTYKVAAVVPTVSEVSPNTGPTTGGTAITITGTGFVSGATVVIGQGSGSVTGVIPATSVVVVSSTEITAVTGSGAKAGTWSLFVHTTGGTSAGNAGADFVYS
jgi:hypothetical protein